MNVLMWLGGSFDRRTPSEHLLVSIIEALYKEGHTVHILQKDTGGDLPSIPKKIRHLGVTTNSIPLKQANKSNFIARYLYDLKYILKCEKLLKNKNNFDVVFLQSNNEAGFITKYIKKKMRLPVLFNVQDIFPYNAAYSGKIKQNGVIFKILRKVQNIGYQYSDIIVTISEDMKKQLIDDGVPEKKIEVVYNWSYQDESYSRDLLDFTIPEQIFDKSKFNVLYAGNIGVMQNVDVLVEAARYLRNENEIQIHIVGDGVYKEKLIEFKEKYDLKNIKFWDMFDSSVAPALYYSADINVIPLAKNIYKTALPSKTATCLACNKPIIFCVGKDSLFCKKIKEECQCPVLDSNDARELASKIISIKSKMIGYDFKSFYEENCSKSKNSLKYINMLENLKKEI